MDATAISSLMGTLGTLGVLVWYLWYNESKVRPQQDERESLARKEYLAALERTEARHEEATSKLVASLNDVRIGLVTVCQARFDCDNYKAKGGA